VCVCVCVVCERDTLSEGRPSAARCTHTRARAHTHTRLSLSLSLSLSGWDGKMNLSSVEALDVSNPTGWRAQAALQVPRCSLTCAATSDAIYVS